MSYLEKFSDFTRVQEETEASKRSEDKQKSKELQDRSDEEGKKATEYKKKYEDERDDSKKEELLLKYKLYRAKSEMLEAQSKLLKKGIKEDE